jgi:hypothetical protein
MKDEALKLALEALEAHADIGIKSDKAITAIKAALAVQSAPVQEPISNKYNDNRIAWELARTAMGDGYYGKALYEAMDMPQTTKNDREVLHRYMCGSNLKTDHVKLQDLAMRICATPPAAQRQWVGLTFAEICECEDEYLHKFARAIEAKLRSKNG